MDFVAPLIALLLGFALSRTTNWVSKPVAQGMRQLVIGYALALGLLAVVGWRGLLNYGELVGFEAYTTYAALLAPWLVFDVVRLNRNAQVEQFVDERWRSAEAVASESTISGRLGNALYWFFATVSVLTIYGFLVATFNQGNASNIVGAALAPLPIYAFGYAIRYVLTGRKRVW